MQGLLDSIKDGTRPAHGDREKDKAEKKEKKERRRRKKVGDGSSSDESEVSSVTSTRASEADTHEQMEAAKPPKSAGEDLLSGIRRTLRPGKDKDNKDKEKDKDAKSGKEKDKTGDADKTRGRSILNSGSSSQIMQASAEFGDLSVSGSSVGGAVTSTTRSAEPTPQASAPPATSLSPVRAPAKQDAAEPSQSQASLAPPPPPSQAQAPAQKQQAHGEERQTPENSTPPRAVKKASPGAATGATTGAATGATTGAAAGAAPGVFSLNRMASAVPEEPSDSAGTPPAPSSAAAASAKHAHKPHHADAGVPAGELVAAHEKAPASPPAQPPTASAAKQSGESKFLVVMNNPGAAVGSTLDRIKIAFLSVAHVAAVMAVAWLFGALGFSLAWVVLLVAAVVKYDSTLKRRQHSIAYHQLRLKDLHDSEPETEAMRWLNVLLGKLFPLMTKELASQALAVLRTKIEESLRDSKPPGVHEILVTQLTLGDLPPELHQVKAFAPTATKYQVDASLDYHGQAALVLQIIVGPTRMAVPVHVSDLEFSGRMRFELELADADPFIRKLHFAFKKKPQLTVNIKPLFNVPFPLSDWIVDTAMAVVSEMLVAPNRMTIDMAPPPPLPESSVQLMGKLAHKAENASASLFKNIDVVSHAREKKESKQRSHSITQHLKAENLGMLHVKVVEALNLPVADKMSRSSDPFVFVNIGGQIHKTKTIMRNRKHPVWDERFEFYVPVNEAAHLCYFEVHDWDSATPSDFLGAAQFNFHEMVGSNDTEKITKILPLSNTQTVLPDGNSVDGEHRFHKATKGVEKSTITVEFTFVC